MGLAKAKHAFGALRAGSELLAHSNLYRSKSLSFRHPNNPADSLENLFRPSPRSAGEMAIVISSRHQFARFPLKESLKMAWHEVPSSTPALQSFDYGEVGHLFILPFLPCGHC